MVKKLGILGFILVVVAAAGMVWAETYTGAIPAPQPTLMPAAAPACVGGMCAPAKVKPPVLQAQGTQDHHRRQDELPRAAPAAHACHELRAASHSRGGAHVEVHRALAPIRILSAC